MTQFDSQRNRGFLLGCTAIACIAAATSAGAQVPSGGTAAVAPSPPDNGGLQEIVVTAQKRSQNLQDVPVAVTAIGRAALITNRVTDVVDLNSLAPNVTVRLAAGGTALPAFSVRGIVSYGVVPGADKEVSIYIDGVYLGATRGSAFDLPEIDRIEVLRGPQGTLFGRNATAGAVSIVTRDPPGKFGVHQELSYGNYDQFRSKTRVDLPTVGPFSASVTYLHNQRRGDIRNTGAGQVWDRTGPETGLGMATSPKYLGDKNADSVFAALKFAPTSNFTAVYKFDYVTNHFTPEGVAAVAVSPVLSPVLAGILNAQPNPIQLDTSGKRPDALNNSFAVPGYEKSFGHNLTTNWRLDPHLSIKNIFAYRHNYVFGVYQLDGLGGLVNTNALLGPVGQPFVLLANQNRSKSSQWSDEAQINYDSRIVTLTAGALYFHLNTVGGAPIGEATSLIATVLPNGKVPLNGPVLPYNRASSIAGYAQAELHVASTLDIVSGYRLTHDNKSGTLYTAIAPPASFTYSKTKPSYLIGVNYKPDRDFLLYGKYSTAFVSGGAVGPLAFAPETAKSWEAGIKSELFDRHIRANLALFDVEYRDIQAPQTGSNVGYPALGTILIDQGNARAKGAEFETTILPVNNVTLGASLGYTDVKYQSVNSLLGTVANYLPALRPKWTSNLSAQYLTAPVFGDTRLHLNADATWRSRERLDPNPVPASPAYNVLQYSPQAWVVNARASLDDIMLQGGTKATIALWVKNLNNDRSIAFADVLTGLVGSASFQPARTFGADLILDF